MHTRLIGMLGALALLGTVALLGGCSKPEEPTPPPAGAKPAPGLPGSTATDDGKSAMPGGGPPK
nr:hypothetical protein [Armatimonas sp.]